MKNNIDMSNESSNNELENYRSQETKCSVSRNDRPI